MDAPNRKVTAGALAGALAALVMWMIQDGFDISAPPGIEAAVTVLFTFLVSYIVRESPENNVPVPEVK